MPASAKLKGRYELKEVLAKGGMGVVYRAVDGVMRRQVAIKTLLDMTDAIGLQLFQKECEVLASQERDRCVAHWSGATRSFCVVCCGAREWS